MAIKFRNKKGWDDALDVWGVHGVGGFSGILMLGLAATLAVNPNGANGLIFGNPLFFLLEFVAVAGAEAYAFLFTYSALWLINKITPVKVPESVEEALDKYETGEKAYTED